MKETTKVLFNHHFNNIVVENRPASMIDIPISPVVKRIYEACAYEKVIKMLEKEIEDRDTMLFSYRRKYFSENRRINALRRKVTDLTGILHPDLGSFE